jgi:hypothetical protein
VTPASEDVPDDRPVGNLRWPGSGDGDPLTTPRVDLLAVGAGAATAVLLGVLLPANPLLAAVAAGPVAGLANRVYDAELAVGFLAGTLGAVCLAALGALTTLLSVGGAAAGGVALLAPFVGLLAGGLALAVGRASERFAAGRRDG